MMRALLLFALLTGFAMTTATAMADDKKEKDPSNPDSYDLTLSVRYWNGKKFLNPVENVKAFKRELPDGTQQIWTQSSLSTFGNPDKKTELILGDDTWVVTEVAKGTTHTVCTVKKKPKDK